MKDLIAKLKSDATCAIGAIWLHIDAQAARIAELEAQIAASPAYTDKLREALPYNKSLIFNMSRRFAVVSAFGDQSEPERFVFDSNSLMRYVEEIGSFLIAQRDYNMDMALQAPVREVPGWQPIETAPKDGTHILLWWGEQARLGWWLDNSHTRTPWAGWKVPSLQVVPFGCQPSHWMPMPAAPVQKEGE